MIEASSHEYVLGLQPVTADLAGEKQAHEGANKSATCLQAHIGAVVHNVSSFQMQLRPAEQSASSLGPSWEYFQLGQKGRDTLLCCSQLGQKGMGTLVCCSQLGQKGRGTLLCCYQLRLKG